MAYEKLRGPREFTSAFLVSWSARGKQMRINSAMTRELRAKGWERVDILVDNRRTCIAIAPSTDGRKVARANADQSSVCCEAILREIRRWGFKAGRWIVRYNTEGNLEIDLLGDQITGPLSHVEATQRFNASKVQADAPDPSTH